MSAAPYLHILDQLSDSSVSAACGPGVFPHRGSPLVAGNPVRLLEDACDNYPAWLEAIRAAQH